MKIFKKNFSLMRQFHKCGRHMLDVKAQYMSKGNIRKSQNNMTALKEYILLQ